MKKYEFDNKGKQWDSFGAFHKRNGIFVEFETGELSIVVPRPDPADRRYYDRYGIQVVATSDSDCPALYTSKDAEEPVKPAWLNQNGHQYIAVDREQGVAIRLKRHWGREVSHKHLPRHLEQSSGLWTGPHRLPIPVNTFTVSLPDRTIRNSLAKKLDDVRAAVTAVFRIGGEQKNPYGYYGTDSMQALPVWDDMTTEQIVADILPHDNLVRNVALRGFTFPRAEKQYEYLFIK